MQIQLPEITRAQEIIRKHGNIEELMGSIPKFNFTNEEIIVNYY